MSNFAFSVFKLLVEHLVEIRLTELHHHIEHPFVFVDFVVV